MTHDQLMTYLDPVIAAAFIGFASVLTVILNSLAGRAKAYLDAKGQSAASAVVMDASALAQTAMANSAGRLALQVQAGTLDVTKPDQVRAAAEAEERRILQKLPDAVAVLKPAVGSLAEGVEGKLGALTAAALASAPLGPSVAAAGVGT